MVWRTFDARDVEEDREQTVEPNADSLVVIPPWHQKKKDQWQASDGRSCDSWKSDWEASTWRWGWWEDKYKLRKVEPNADWCSSEFWGATRRRERLSRLRHATTKFRHWTDDRYEAMEVSDERCPTPCPS